MPQTARSIELDKKLLTYALVAGAGMAASQPALCGPIQSVGNPALGTHVFTGSEFLPVDLNQDGTEDVVFGSILYSPGLYLYALAHGAIKTSPSQFVGPLMEFYAGKPIAAAYSPSVVYPQGRAFLGVEFTAGPDLHYGFLRMSISGDPSVPSLTLNIEDIWYESTPEAPIHVSGVPEPGSLGLLALGAVGLGLWRKRKGQA